MINIVNRSFPAKLGYNRIGVCAVTPEGFVDVTDQCGSTSLLFLGCCAAHWCAPGPWVLAADLSKASLSVELPCELCESGTDISHGWCTSGVPVISLTARVVQWALRGGCFPIKVWDASNQYRCDTALLRVWSEECWLDILVIPGSWESFGVWWVTAVQSAAWSISCPLGMLQPTL